MEMSVGLKKASVNDTCVGTPPPPECRLGPEGVTNCISIATHHTFQALRKIVPNLTPHSNISLGRPRPNETSRAEKRASLG
uniref:Uncharacterized protein n=1 Tax=Pristionchus pacificus TaxID=54126 RepID=A0A2A6BSW4_PRIPA|eukprot:PDM68978.1 hypothetical protein PRIPAC_47280 [Pristionchus pacificus]